MTKQELEAAVGGEVGVSVPTPTKEDPAKRETRLARLKGIRGNGADVVLLREGRSMRVPFAWVLPAS